MRSPSTDKTEEIDNAPKNYRGWQLSLLIRGSHYQGLNLFEPAVKPSQRYTCDEVQSSAPYYFAVFSPTHDIGSTKSIFTTLITTAFDEVVWTKPKERQQLTEMEAEFMTNLPHRNGEQ